MSSKRTLHFAADVSVLASVRDFSVNAARELGSTVDQGLLEVVVGELAANSVVHQPGPAQIELSLLPNGGLAIRVFDSDQGAPRLVDSSAVDLDGHRGLQLIAALATDWGVDRQAEGKWVWAHMAGNGDAAGVVDTERSVVSIDG